ncbi:MAG: carbonic anhydrase [Chitinophagales bacterium]|nr:carbonic anhydrase [Chitinophagales bacterium]
MPSIEVINKLLDENKIWAKEQVKVDPGFFERLEALQTPEFLWIGCSDSRVPANQITNTKPGEIFVHRNVANLAVNGDLNMLSVLQYSVEVLKVKHIILCGHYGCGGVAAAMTNKSFGLLDNWLRNIKDVYRLHKAEVDALPTAAEKNNRMVELNVQEQVLSLAKTNIVQNAWLHHQRPHIHGWVYSLHDGIIKPILTIDPNTDLDTVYRLDV